MSHLSRVANFLCSTGKLQRRMGFLTVHRRWGDVGYNGSLTITPKSRLQNSCQLGVTVRDVRAVDMREQYWGDNTQGHEISTSLTTAALHYRESGKNLFPSDSLHITVPSVSNDLLMAPPSRSLIPSAPV